MQPHSPRSPATPRLREQRLFACTSVGIMWRAASTVEQLTRPPHPGFGSEGYHRCHHQARTGGAQRCTHTAPTPEGQPPDVRGLGAQVRTSFQPPGAQHPSAEVRHSDIELNTRQFQKAHDSSYGQPPFQTPGAQHPSAKVRHGRAFIHSEFAQ